MRAVFTVCIAILAAFAYRHRRVLRHTVLSKPSLPAALYAEGNYMDKCVVHKSEPTSNNVDVLRYCEDAAFWDHLDSSGDLQARLVLISCDPNRKAWNTVMGPLLDPNPRGALWVYSPDVIHAEPQPISLVGYPEGHDFHPLGIDIWPSRTGSKSNLFAVNHDRHHTTIEQFSISPSHPTQAKWVRTLSSKYFISPNSLALTSPTSFYVTNDHLMTRRLPSILGHILPAIETMLVLPFSWVSHVSIVDDDTGSFALEHHFAAKGIPFSNGVALTRSGRQLAVASSNTAQVRFYARDTSDNSLTFTHAVPVPVLPDNVMFDDDDALIAAGHAHLPSLKSVAANQTGAVAPSLVVVLTPQLRQRGSMYALNHTVETLYQSDGTHFQTSSTGLKDSITGALFVTGLYEDGVLICTP